MSKPRRVERWNRFSVIYPAFLSGLIFLHVPGFVTVLIVGSITLALWWTQPLGLVFDDLTVTFRVLPFWGGGIDIPSGDLAARVGKDYVSFRTISRRRIPISPWLWWNRTWLETEDDDDCVVLLRDHGLLVEDRRPR